MIVLATSAAVAASRRRAVRGTGHLLSVVGTADVHSLLPTKFTDGLEVGCHVVDLSGQPFHCVQLRGWAKVVDFSFSIVFIHWEEDTAIYEVIISSPPNHF